LQQAALHVEFLLQVLAAFYGAIAAVFNIFGRAAGKAMVFFPSGYFAFN
jgi:hypothetical protein